MNRRRFKKLRALWDEADDEILLLQYYNRMPPQAIADYHLRTERPIKQRIKLLLLQKRFIDGV
jgi:hypothetical protein